MGPLLGLETATRHVTVAMSDGRRVVAHSQADRESVALLDLVDQVLHRAGVAIRAVSGIAVGTGPGSFTGLRVGLATAKTMAHELGVPIVGVSTAEALASSVVTADPSLAGRPLGVLLPAGARDHYLTRVICQPVDSDCRAEPTQLVPPDIDLADALRGAMGVVVGWVDASMDGAASRGAAAVTGLGEALVRIAARRLEAGAPVDDALTLVPSYVALPRGITDAAQGMGWSPDLR